ncbi:hypothetical protein QQ020_35920 [Fulvivirgaceae bacterium BMA12]|uniref:YD repeat-containing protein n=1 Tax=Agaribacillus aureus TaxID=3051825 RepID=A0ABT8LK23_9BACT|nr:hypothetical protein [Fulvivirgaceae bacterium BMA12]
MKIKLFLILALLSVNTIAQDDNVYNDVTISSPTAASLGKYGDIPVNFHTGIPNISIPIYTVTEGPLQLPISLSYHASGMKVMETASWVGAGWSLNAGGVITRTVNGAPDERFTNNVSDQTHGHFSDHGYNNYYYDINNFPDWESFLAGTKDGEPDFFFFNFLGNSGKFYFDDDRTPVLIPEQDIKIEVDYNETSNESISSFTLTTPDGIKYYFGRTDDALDTDPVEKTKPFTASAGAYFGNALSSWYLHKITSADSLFEINLSYEAEDYSYWTISMFPVLAGSNEDEFKIVKNIVEGVRLSQITFSHGQVDFVADTLRLDLGGTTADIAEDSNTQAKRLDAIKISDAGSYCKEFVFAYSYFEDNTSSLPPDLTVITINTDRKRLKLDSFQEQTCNGLVSKPAHTFTYFSDFVPRRLTFAQDHWGFYNGATNNDGLIPTYFEVDMTEVTGADREASWPEMRAGSLQRITYPTGGYSEFDFEAHNTWTVYSVNEVQEILNFTSGFDGNPGTQIRSLVSNGGVYDITLSSSAVGGLGILEIYDSNSNYVNGLTASAGTTNKKSIILPVGTYSIELRKDVPSTGNGTEVWFHQANLVNYQENATVGGLRIKTMTHHDAIAIANNQVISYTYEIGGQSTGILYGRPSYVQVIRNDIIKDAGFFTADPNEPPQITNGCPNFGLIGPDPFFKSPSSIRPMGSTQGNHIGYNEVKVSQAGNGHSIFRYYGSDFWDNNNDRVAYVHIDPCDINTANYPPAPLPHEFKRGELKYEGHFDESSQLLQSRDYFPVFSDATGVTPAFKVSSYLPGKLLGTRYELKTARKTETKVIETNRDPGAGSIISTNHQFMESPFHNQVSRSMAFTSEGDTLETQWHFAADFQIPDCSGIANTCQEDLDTELSASLTNYLATVGGCTTQVCRHNEYQNYIQRNTQARVDFLACSNSYTTSYDSCYAVALASATTELKVILDLQQQFSNPPLEITQWHQNKLLRATYNEYDYTISPADQVYPKNVQLVSVANPATNFTGAASTNTAITKDGQYQEEVSYHYHDGNLVEIIGKDGLTTSYYWGYNNTLPIIKAIGATYSTLSAVYTLEGGNLDQIRNNASLADAQVTTFVYDPLIGMTSQTDPNGITTFYEYDDLNRLELIKDHEGNILQHYEYHYHNESQGGAQ